MRRFVLAAAFSLGATISCRSGGTERVLLVQSYHEGYAWTDAITRGVETGLQGRNIELKAFYMDTKRRTDEAWKAQAGEEAKAIVDSFDPDVVITADDNAQGYFARDYAGKDRPRIVFCGVNAEPGEYGFPASNVTGILERNKIRESLDMLIEIDRRVKRVALISDDSNTSTWFIAYMKTLPLPVEVVAYDQPSTFAEWQETVKRREDAGDALVVMMYHTVKLVAGGQSMAPAEVMGWTSENYAKPIVGMFDFTIQDGALCGVAESGEDHGFEAARIAVALLDGKKASDLPVAINQAGRVAINLVAAEKLGLFPPFGAIEVSDIVVEKKE